MLAHRPLRLAVPALAAALALTACGETVRSSPTDKATPRAVPTVPSTVNPAPTKSAAPSASASASVAPTASETGGGGGGNEVAATAANKFDPATLTVKKGTKVTWTATGYHTVTSGDPATGADASGPMKSAAGFTTYSVTFDKPGTYKYFCQPHAGLGMAGEIVVT